MPYLFGKEKGGLGLHWYKGKSFRWNLVQFIINFNLISNNGKFKEGDVVRYNWMAKVHLGKYFLKDGKNVWNRNLMVTKVLNKYKSNIEYMVCDTPEIKSGCACFWIRKAYWWEI